MGLCTNVKQLKKQKQRAVVLCQRDIKSGLRQLFIPPADGR
jgi:hypothetical protein